MRFSKSGRTIYYKGRRLRTLKGRGFKANYVDLDSREGFWISGPHRDGRDTLDPMEVRIDRDLREACWLGIRGLPERVADWRYRSPGKYSRRRPHPWNPNRPADGR